jgi:hypothetical protein
MQQYKPVRTVPCWGLKVNVKAEFEFRDGPAGLAEPQQLTTMQSILVNKAGAPQGEPVSPRTAA